MTPDTPFREPSNEGPDECGEMNQLRVKCEESPVFALLRLIVSESRPFARGIGRDLNAVPASCRRHAEDASACLHPRRGDLGRAPPRRSGCARGDSTAATPGWTSGA